MSFSRALAPIRRAAPLARQAVVPAFAPVRAFAAIAPARLESLKKVLPTIKYDLKPKPQLNPHPLSEYVAWAGHRNRGPVLEVIKAILSDSNKEYKVLEVATGSGMHLNFFASALPNALFQPTDYVDETFATIAQKTRESGNLNVLNPQVLDVTDVKASTVTKKQYDLILAINMFQVLPQKCVSGLLDSAAALLKPGGTLLLYGPFTNGGKHNGPSDAEFDAQLRSFGNPDWGYKDVQDFATHGKKVGVPLTTTINMPNNNFSLIFERVK